MNNPIFLLAAAGLGLFVVTCYSKSQVQSGAQEQKDPVRLLKHYADVDSEWSNPMNLTTNPRIVKKIWREPGPLGVEREVYEGAGESWITLYSDNYAAL
jgi:hypothetical protein